jgi:hypothetical protein
MKKLRNLEGGEIVARVSGVDQNGKRFWQTAVVTSATRERIRVNQLPECCNASETVTLVFEKKEAEYKISARLKNDEIELTPVGKTACIFPDELLETELPPAEEENASASPAAPKQVVPLPVTLGASRPEKRKFPRVVLRVPVEVRSDLTGSSAFGTTSDISPGGCYVEIMSPMPVGAEVEVFSATGVKAKGKVVTAHPTVGMGIAFGEDHPEIVELLFRSTSENKESHKAEPSAPTQKEERPASAELRGNQTEQLFSRLVWWFADHPNLGRDEFCELVQRIASNKQNDPAKRSR